MDAAHFDALARSLIATSSRRRALVALSGALGVLKLSRLDDASAGGKCKPKCPECEKCKKGKKGKKGKCKPKPAGTACSAGTCQNGSCIAQTCTPNCTDKICGDNGCGGSCGSCGVGGGCVGGGCICSDRTCSGGTCAADNLTCCPEDATLSTCTGSTNANCYCVKTTEGNPRCHLGGQGCNEFGACTSSSTCPAGKFCSDDPSVCQGFCMRGCT